MLFTDTFLHGGTERQLVRIACSMDPYKYEVTVGCLRRVGPLLSEVEAAGIQVVEFPIHSFYTFHTARVFGRLVRFLRKQQIAVLHAFDFYTDVFAVPAAWLAGVQVILASRREITGLRSAKQRLALRIAREFATGVVVNSEAARQHLVGLRPRSRQKVAILPNCIDLEKLKPRLPMKEVREQLRIPIAVPLVGVLGNLRPEKDVGTFIRAAKHIRMDLPDARFLLIGDGSERESLMKLAAELGLSDTTYFLGDRRDVPDLLAALDVLVLTSTTESSPNAILEGMAVGLPVVATNIGGIPELVTHGLTGYLFPPGDARVLAGFVVHLMREPSLRQKMGSAGRERVERDFSVATVLKKLGAFYNEMLKFQAGWA